MELHIVIYNAPMLMGIMLLAVLIHSVGLRGSILPSAIAMIFYQGSTDFGLRFPDIRQYTTSPSRYAKKGNILMSVRAPVGTLNIANNDCCIGRGLSALSSKLGSITHLYYTMNDFRLKFEGMNSAGTTFGLITKDELYNLPVIVPHKLILSEFEKACDPIFGKQMVIGKEINILTKQRDELLPLLMNGQATVNYHLSAFQNKFTIIVQKNERNNHRIHIGTS